MDPKSEVGQTGPGPVPGWRSVGWVWVAGGAGCSWPASCRLWGYPLRLLRLVPLIFIIPGSGSRHLLGLLVTGGEKR